jgi:hypothetical protein
MTPTPQTPAPKPPIHLVVGTPCFGGMVTQRYMQCVYTLLRWGLQNGIEISLEMLGYESLITRGRNTLLATFLDKPTATHLMFIDADMGFEPMHVGRLLDFDGDVAAGMYPLKQINWDAPAIERAVGGEHIGTSALRYVGAFCEGEALKVRDGFATAQYAGTGFMLIKRAAVERMIEAYPETRYLSAHNQARPSPNSYALFDTLIHPQTGEYLSEDYAFCHRLRAIGGEVWLDTDSCLVHVGAHEFIGDAYARFGEAIEAVTMKRRAAA